MGRKSDQSSDENSSDYTAANVQVNLGLIE
jgi:hypothetical protein